MPHSGQELILAQEVGGLAIWEWNVESDQVRWLPGALALFGRAPEQIQTGRQMLALVHEEDRELVRQEVRKGLLDTGKLRLEFRVICPNGELHYIEGRARISDTTEHGRIAICVAQDVTDRTARENSLQEQARLLDLAYEPILVRDSEDLIIFWNKGAERLYGYTAAEAKGQSSHSLLRTRFPQPVPDIQSHLLREAYWEGELIHQKKDGSLVHVASRWQRFTNGCVSTLETNFDLSQQRALHLARAWEEKAKLIGEMAHEVNNPLAAARTAAYMLRHGCDKDMHRYVELLEDSITRVAEFIRQSNELHQRDHFPDFESSEPQTDRFQ